MTSVPRRRPGLVGRAQEAGHRHRTCHRHPPVPAVTPTGAPHATTAGPHSMPYQPRSNPSGATSPPAYACRAAGVPAPIRAAEGRAAGCCIATGPAATAAGRPQRITTDNSAGSSGHPAAPPAPIRAAAGPAGSPAVDRPRRRHRAAARHRRPAGAVAGHRPRRLRQRRRRPARQDRSRSTRCAGRSSTASARRSPTRRTRRTSPPIRSRSPPADRLSTRRLARAAAVQAGPHRDGRARQAGPVRGARHGTRSPIAAQQIEDLDLPGIYTQADHAAAVPRSDDRRQRHRHRALRRHRRGRHRGRSTTACWPARTAA